MGASGKPFRRYKEIMKRRAGWAPPKLRPFSRGDGTEAVRLSPDKRKAIALWIGVEDIADGIAGGLWICARDGYEWADYGDWILMDPDGTVDVRKEA
ncbi:MAG: hypothetical protein LBR80_04210 [Deltaproteobacteria bacterium]|jgi:hypothetical protein|nr:hypothetical protein [Deltaproteobacteria bacterium]